MVKFKNLFRFSRQEVTLSLEHAKLKTLWRGLKLLQAPLSCLNNIQTGNGEVDEPAQIGKILIITPATCGKASQRNLFRRRVKNIFYTQKLYVHPLVSVLIVRKEAMDLNVKELEKFLKKNIVCVTEKKPEA